MRRRLMGENCLMRAQTLSRHLRRWRRSNLQPGRKRHDGVCIITLHEPGAHLLAGPPLPHKVKKEENEPTTLWPSSNAPDSAVAAASYPTPVSPIASFSTRDTFKYIVAPSLSQPISAHKAIVKEEEISYIDLTDLVEPPPLTAELSFCTYRFIVL